MSDERNPDAAPLPLEPPAGRIPPPRDDVALMAGYHSPQLVVDVRLNTNEAPERPPANFYENLAEGLSSLELNRYPDREATALREAIGALHGVGIERVFCANGSNEVIQSLLLAYGPGRAVALFEPTYALHSHIARITGTEVLLGERDEEYLVSEDELARVLTLAERLGSWNPVITFLCSPNNPTGRAEPLDTITQVLDAAPGLVVVDEAYGQFSRTSALELAYDRRNLVVIRTFSKTWSLAGLRLGYAIADPEVIEAMGRVTLPYHLDAIKQLAGRLALDDVAAMQARVARLTEERGRVAARLARLPVEAIPSDANFICFRPLRRDARELWRYLVQRSILIRDVGGWPRLAGCLRVTIGTPEENDAFVEALEDVLS